MRCAPALRLLAVLTISVAALNVARADDNPGWTPLFNGKDLTGWKRFLEPGKGGEPDKVWTIADGVITCTGKPAGYIITEKEYDSFVLKFEWRWPSKPGNSGCFVYVVGEDKIWPKGVEAQLMHEHAGDFWLVDNFKLDIDAARKDPKSDRHWFRTKDKVEKPAGEWNQYEVYCQGDTVRLVINGQDVNVGMKPELTKGKILLQSEGAEIQFRNIAVKPLK